MLEGYSSAAVTTLSPGRQGNPSAISPMPCVVLLTNAISSRWAFSRRRRLAADHFEACLRVRPADDAVIFLFGRPRPQDISAALGKWGGRGVVEIRPAPGYRKLGISQQAPVDRHHPVTPITGRGRAGARSSAGRLSHDEEREEHQHDRAEITVERTARPAAGGRRLGLLCPDGLIEGGRAMTRPMPSSGDGELAAECASKNRSSLALLDRDRTTSPIVTHRQPFE